MSVTQFFLLILLAAIWGASFLFMRITAPILGPFVVTASRLLLAAIFLITYNACSKQVPFKQLPWRKITILAFFNAALPFTLFAFAEMHITASLGAILNAMTPIFTAVLASIYLRERYRSMQMLGSLLGFCGVIVVVGWHPLPLNLTNTLAILACLGASIAYAIGAIYASNQVKTNAPLAVAIGQQCAGFMILLPFAACDLPTQLPSLSIASALLCLGILSTGVAYLIYFKLMHEIGPSKTITLTYILPFFGGLWGFLFLGEEIHASLIVGLVIILLGIFLINGKFKTSR